MDKRQDDENISVEQHLQSLRQATKEDIAVSQIVCDYIDQVNQGKLVTKADFLAQAPSQEVKEEVASLLGFSEALLDLGKTWRQKQKKANATRSSIE